MDWEGGGQAARVSPKRHYLLAESLDACQASGAAATRGQARGITDNRIAGAELHTTVRVRPFLPSFRGRNDLTITATAKQRLCA
jgi:hypothetical protein